MCFASGIPGRIVLGEGFNEFVRARIGLGRPQVKPMLLARLWIEAAVKKASRNPSARLRGRDRVLIENGMARMTFCTLKHPHHATTPRPR